MNNTTGSMIFMKKCAAALALICIFPMLLCSCASEKPNAKRKLAILMSQYRNLPAGRCYTLTFGEPDNTENSENSESSDSRYLTDILAFSLYGNTELSGDGKAGSNKEGKMYPEEFALIDDCAVWLCSGAEPCEFAVFHVRAASDAETVAKMLFRRLEKLKKHWRESDYYEMVASCKIHIEGRYVTFALNCGE